MINIRDGFMKIQREAIFAHDPIKKVLYVYMSSLNAITLDQLPHAILIGTNHIVGVNAVFEKSIIVSSNVILGRVYYPSPLTKSTFPFMIDYCLRVCLCEAEYLAL